MGAKIFSLVVAILANFLVACSSNEELLRKFDAKSHHITDPIVQIMKSKNFEILKLDYVEKYHPGALVCFFPAYGHADLFRTNISPEIIKKYNISKEIIFVPKDRSVYDNEMGFSIVSKGLQYNYSIKNYLGISKNINGVSTEYHCSEAKNTFIKKVRSKEKAIDLNGNEIFPLTSVLIEDQK